jgi:hypothetical protein
MALVEDWLKKELKPKYNLHIWTGVSDDPKYRD